MKWANNACLNYFGTLNGYLKRRLLAQNIFLIRFPAMSCSDFSKCLIMEPNLLTSQEKFRIYMLISSEKPNCLNKRRSQLISSNKNEDDTDTIAIKFEEKLCTNHVYVDQTPPFTVKSYFNLIFTTQSKIKLHSKTFTMQFSISEDIEINALEFYSRRRKIEFKIFNSERNNLNYCKSKTKTINKSCFKITFEPTKIKKYETYFIQYTFLDGDEVESIISRNFEPILEFIHPKEPSRVLTMFIQHGSPHIGIIHFLWRT